ncbi:hypothetical protein QVD17_20929 [Tagetes erecta]|uniref:Uncharacterized protein n=1 Tax=Tagetes erecta TaxID=13708 RepID=A0AAD8KTP7_TARER|nr:hypothetical protein QVD17_20929 [Tagetes erecta]
MRKLCETRWKLCLFLAFKVVEESDSRVVGDDVEASQLKIKQFYLRPDGFEQEFEVFGTIISSIRLNVCRCIRGDEDDEGEGDEDEDEGEGVRMKMKVRG